MVSRSSIVFVSDLHFGLPVDRGERQRRDSFLRFLVAIRGVERLVIAGDLFQFWFDLGATIPQGHFDILRGLATLRESGTTVDYLAGNHDYWRGPFFGRELGIAVHAGDLSVETQGRRILVKHGDGAGPGDLGYKLFKRFARHPLSIAAARLVHPDLLLAVARRLDRASHQTSSQQLPDRRRLLAAAHQAWAAGFDALIMGHVHVQLLEDIDGKQLCVIGDWLTLRSFVTLHDGRLTAGRWEDEPRAPGTSTQQRDPAAFRPA